MEMGLSPKLMTFAQLVTTKFYTSYVFTTYVRLSSKALARMFYVLDDGLMGVNVHSV